MYKNKWLKHNQLLKFGQESDIYFINFIEIS